MYFTSFQGSLIQFTRLWMKTIMETDFERARLDMRINRMEECRLDSSGSGQGQVAGSCENGNEPYKVEGIS